MLTREIIENSIKKFKPEGFRWTDENIFYLPNGKHYAMFKGYDLKYIDYWDCYVYPNLLTRLIEAINKNSVAVVNYKHPHYMIFKTTYLEPDECFDAEADPDLAKEEVIKYVMENL